MADDFTQLNQNFSPGDTMDEEGVTYGSGPSPRKRARVVIGGALAAALAAVQNILPRLSDYGLTVRIAGNRSETLTPITPVAASTTAVLLLAANAAGRIGFILVNNSTSPLYISSSSGVTAGPSGNWVLRLAGGTTLTADQANLAGYSGALYGVWDVATGQCNGGELT